MKNDGTFLVEPTTEPTTYDLGFVDGYEDFHRESPPVYTIRPRGIYEMASGTNIYARMTKVSSFARGYIAGFVKAHDDTFGR